MPSVLSLQSHVTHGYVGNRAATFPLQYLGWDVDALNTVQLSNHTGYGNFAGTKATAQEIETIYDKLKELEFHYDAFLTGYSPTAQGVEAMGKIGQDLKARFPDLLWLMDPVMGDEGRLYVSEEVIPVYKDILKSGKVSLITPNGFEAETLTGIKLDSTANILQALDKLHNEYKVPNVVISSVVVEGKLWTIGSTAGFMPFYFETEPINSYFTGTGDFFAAILLSNLYNTPKDLRNALGRTLFVVRKILLETYNHARSKISGRVERGDWRSMRHLELRVIPCRKELEAIGSVESHDLK